MLKGELRDDIEQIQKRASKVIFGWNSSYDELIASGKLVSLEDRREKLTTNFAKKAAQDERFKHWFPIREYHGLNLRNE